MGRCEAQERTMTRQVFVGTIQKHLSDRQQRIRNAIIARIEAKGLVARSVRGIWSPQACLKVMKNCQGVVLIGFPRCSLSDTRKKIKLATGILHCEAMLARTLRLPILTIVEKGVAERGV